MQQIAHTATPLIGKKSEEIRKIQIFIDELNGLLDRSCDCLKRSFAVNTLFNFIDGHRDCLGIEERDIYEAPALYHAFHEYLPRWCDAARKTVTHPPHIPYFDPGLARIMMGKSISAEVNEAVRKKLPLPPMAMGSSQVSYRQLFDLKVYRSFVELNGMDYEVLKPFSGVSKLVYFYSLQGIPPKETPIIQEYQLVSADEPVGEPSVTVLQGAGFPMHRGSSGHFTVDFEGKTYRALSSRSSDASWIFQRTPMLTLVYKTLERKLDAALSTSDRF